MLLRYYEGWDWRYDAGERQGFGWYRILLLFVGKTNPPSPPFWALFISDQQGKLKTVRQCRVLWQGPSSEVCLLRPIANVVAGIHDISEEE